MDYKTESASLCSPAVVLLGSSSIDRYNPVMNQPVRHRYLPDADRLSILAASILLAYALASYIHIPARQVGFQLPGIYLSVQLNVHTVVALLVAGLTATGSHQLLRDHPELGSERTIGHWLLPALTALVIGFPLYQIPPSLLWWLGFALGGALLMLVLVAEYVAVDPEDVRYTSATIGLTAVSFALFLALAIALRITGTRLWMIVPALSMAAGLVSLRALWLRIPGKWQFANAGVITLVVGQFAAALHYWPISPAAFGLVLLGPAYSLTSFLGNIAEGETPRQSVIEPVVVLLLIWGTAILFH